jgi:hypothetical protein
MFGGTGERLRKLKLFLTQVRYTSLQHVADYPNFRMAAEQGKVFADSIFEHHD